MKNLSLLVFLVFASQDLLAGPAYLYAKQTMDPKDGFKCEWRIFEAEAKTDRSLLHFSHPCPLDFLFDSTEARAYYLNPPDLIAVNWKGDMKRQKWALPRETTPAEGESMGPAQIWKDKTTGKIRFAFFDASPARVTTKEQKTDPQMRTVLYKGKNIGTAYALGSVGAAVAYELDGNQWRVVEVKATNAEACDTLGLSMLKMSPAPDTVAPLSADREVFTCAGDSECLKKKTSPVVQKRIKEQFKTEGVYFLRTVKDWALVNAESAESEYSYPGFPAFLLSPQDGKLIPLAGTPATGMFAIAVSKNREWLSLTTSADSPRKTFLYTYRDPSPVKIIEGAEYRSLWVE